MTVAIAISSAVSTLMLVLLLVLPSVSSPTVPFGVRVPAERADDPTVVRQTRIYRWRLMGIGIVSATVGVVLYSLTGEPFLLPLSMVMVVGVWYGCYFAAHNKIRVAKAAGGWYEGLHQGIAVDTELRTHPPRFPWPWLAPALIVTVVTTTIGVISYPSMPEMLVLHHSANGVPDRLAAKSVGTAFSLVFVQIGVTALLVGIAAAVFRGGRSDIDPERPIASARWHRRYMSLGAKALLGLVAMIDVGLLGSSLLMWTGTVISWAPLVVVVPILAGVVVAVVILARNNLERGEATEVTGLIHRDDDMYWRGGLFYVNHEDRALVVPRRFGLGWTLNFGNPMVALLLGGAVTLGGLLITLRFGG
jgi:uncharacterized membrane protein